MNLVHKIFNFYISSSTHVALAVFSLTKISLLENQIIENKIPLFNFFATILLYNFIKFYSTGTVLEKLKFWLKPNNRVMLIFNIVCFILLAILLKNFNFGSIIILSPFFILTVLYVVPISRSSKNLRNVSSLKILLIAVIWAGVVVLFPYKYYQISINGDVYIQFFQIACFVMGITIPFDIRDILVDNPSLSTLPQTIGIRKSKIVGIWTLLIFFFLEFFKSDVLLNRVFIQFIVLLLAIILLVFSSKEQSKYYSSFWVESIPIFWFILYLLISY